MLLSTARIERIRLVTDLIIVVMEWCDFTRNKDNGDYEHVQTPAFLVQLLSN